MLFVLWSFWPDLNRRPIDYESIALPTEPQKHAVRRTDTLIHYMKNNMKMQAFLRRFSYFFLFGDKQAHPSGKLLDLDVPAHALLPVEIPYDVLRRFDQKTVSAHCGNVTPADLAAEQKERNERDICAHPRKKAGAFLLTDDGKLHLSVRHAAVLIDEHARDRAPVHGEDEHGMRLQRLLSARHFQRKDAQPKFFADDFERIGENTELLFCGRFRGIGGARKGARCGNVHGVAPAVQAHDVQSRLMPFEDNFERAPDAARDPEGTRDVVGGAARDIAEPDVLFPDPLQDAVERAVSARKQNDIVLFRAAAGMQRHILPALGGDDIHAFEVREQRLPDIADLLGDFSLAARRMIQKQTIHPFIIPVLPPFGNDFSADGCNLRRRRRSPAASGNGQEQV